MLGALLAGFGCASPPANEQSRLEELRAISRPFAVESADSQQATSSVSLEIVAVGDIMLHYPDQRQYDSSGEPVFGDYFQFVSARVQAADIALCNIEAPFGGGEPQGYPVFNMADEMAPAVAAAGLDVVFTTNNHMLDQGADGVLRSVQILRENGLVVAGSRLEESEPAFALYNAKGLDIAVVAYTYETTPLSGSRAINGIPMASWQDPLINSYTSGSAADQEEIVALLAAARAAGAELIICYFHNGTEYSQTPDSEQREMAQLVADHGADIVFASHPHVIQPMELLEPANGGAPVPVYWALGNFVSNQRLESDMDPENEQGLLATVRLTYNPQSQQLDALSMEYLPLWVDRYSNGERTVHTVIPESANVEENPALAASGHLDRALTAFAQVRELMGETLSWSR